MGKSITQDMAYRQSLMKYAEKYGVGRASRKYNKARSYIYFWRARWDGSVGSLACQSRRPRHHPSQHTEADLRLFQYTAIDEFTRLRFLAAYPEQSTYSSADFLKRLVKWYARRGIHVECVQTDNGTEFTNRLVSPQEHLPTLFERTAAELGIRHEFIRPYTPRHNGKVERSHREDNETFYATRKFYSFDDFKKQLAVRQRQYNAFPMHPLHWRFPIQVLRSPPCNKL